MQPTVLQAYLHERIPLSRANRDSTQHHSVLECAGTRVGELEGEFAVIPT
jgi:hypothetical protein